MTAYVDWSKWLEYKELLDTAEQLTVEDLGRLIAEVKPEVRAKLAEGPLPYRYDCGVCAAFGRSWYRDKKNFDPASADALVFAYHEVPKLHMRFADQEHQGPLADDIYQRCLATYRAAGWI